ncbi:uncharacterized protein LOC129613880 [Condylostylus longicornis]|uniref:uncharacterized protein LOC129613880 n=1 Tax=Condylostylus longicornis TaxID=2530218 RepID=UPI00244E1157|nr:uncharacterized protein LOC129613880 [Condylostylus longicornis]
MASKFKYLESVITAGGKIDQDVKHRVNGGWMKWRTLTRVLCQKRMPPKLKGKLYKTVVRPALMYCTKCWAAQKQHIQKLHVAEMRWYGPISRQNDDQIVRKAMNIKNQPGKEEDLQQHGRKLLRMI